MLAVLAVLGLWLASTSVASASERVYWADVTEDNLQYANLDYSDAGYLYTFPAATQTSVPHTVSPTPTPPPSPGAFPGLTMSKQSVRLTAAGAAPIKVSCPAGTQGRCAGALRLTTIVRAKEGGSKHKTTSIELGAISFAVAAGKQKTLDVRLSGSARARVTDANKLAPRRLCG
jgi:hypothetical protein